MDATIVSRELALSSCFFCFMLQFSGGGCSERSWILSIFPAIVFSEGSSDTHVLTWEGDGQNAINAVALIIACVQLATVTSHHPLFFSNC